MAIRISVQKIVEEEGQFKNVNDVLETKHQINEAKNHFSQIRL